MQPPGIFAVKQAKRKAYAVGKQVIKGEAVYRISSVPSAVTPFLKGT